MPNDSPAEQGSLTPVTDAWKQLGFSRMQQVYYYAKRDVITIVKKGKRNYIDVEKAKLALANRKTQPKQKQEKTFHNIEPVTRLPHLIMWDRGKWRGWCTGFVQQIFDEELPKMVKIVPDYSLAVEGLQTIPVTDTRLFEEHAQGKTFFIEPQLTLGLVANQLYRACAEGCDPRLESVADTLVQCVDQLLTIRNGNGFVGRVGKITQDDDR